MLETWSPDCVIANIGPFDLDPAGLWGDKK